MVLYRLCLHLLNRGKQSNSPQRNPSVPNVIAIPVPGCVFLWMLEVPGVDNRSPGIWEMHLLVTDLKVLA